jgi:uncharacterized protein YbaP (TraB family)
MMPSCLRRLVLAWLAALLLAVQPPAAAQATDTCPPTAQPLTREQTEAGVKAAHDRGFMWRLVKDGRISYLYGTVHIAKRDWIFPGNTLVSAVRGSDIVALELDVLDPSVLQKMSEGIAPRPDRALPPALMERLRTQLRAACLPEAMLTDIAPEMVALTLVVKSARVDGLDPAYGIDAVVAGLAHGLKKNVVSLETPELQLSLLLGRNAREAQASVEQSLADLESGRSRASMVRIAQVWADARFDELFRYEQWCDCLKTEAERAQQKRLLDDRNPALAERIDAMHRAGNRVFAAVGALHMVGKMGLPALLAQRGYQVERMEFR